MNIRRATKEDVESISMLHKKVFDSSYFSVHYSDKLHKKYFYALISSNEYCFVVVDDTHNILGFLISGYQTQKAVDNFMKSNITELALTIIKNPIFIIKGINKYFHRFFVKNRVSKANLRLFLIGVDLASAKMGIGTLLLSEFERAILKEGIKLYGLSVKSDNIDAIEFYNRKGFQFEFKKGDLFCYIKNL